MSKKTDNKDLSLIEMQDICNTKAEELTLKLNRQVTPILFKEGDEWIVGYVKKPTRTDQMIAVGKISLSYLIAGEELLEACLIREESDIRILDESPMYDSIHLGACKAAFGIIEINVDVAKKK